MQKVCSISLQQMPEFCSLARFFKKPIHCDNSILPNKFLKTEAAIEPLCRVFDAHIQNQGQRSPLRRILQLLQKFFANALTAPLRQNRDIYQTDFMPCAMNDECADFVTVQNHQRLLSARETPAIVLAPGGELGANERVFLRRAPVYLRKLLGPAGSIKAQKKGFVGRSGRTQREGWRTVSGGIGLLHSELGAGKPCSCAPFPMLLNLQVQGKLPFRSFRSLSRATIPEHNQ